MKIAGTRPDRQIKARHRFEIVVEHVGPGIDHHLHRPRLPQEVRGENLDRGFRRAPPDRGDDGGEVTCPAIVEIVPVDRGDHRMAQPHPRHRIGHQRRLVGVDRSRQAGPDIAEGAGARRCRPIS